MTNIDDPILKAIARIRHGLRKNDIFFSSNSWNGNRSINK